MDLLCLRRRHLQALAASFDVPILGLDVWVLPYLYPFPVSALGEVVVASAQVLYDGCDGKPRLFQSLYNGTCHEYD